jgi:hypothetical protein
VKKDEKPYKTANNFKTKAKSVLKKIIAYLKVNFSPVSKSDILFSGAPSHRISYKGDFINRYFDPIIDSIGIDYSIAEYQKMPNRKIYKKKRVNDLTAIIPAFSKRRQLNASWNKMEESGNFREFLMALEINKLISIPTLKYKMIKNLNSILNWKMLFKWYLQKSGARAAFELCYYVNPMYGLNLAARELKISSVDMQHGTQGPLHTSYNIQKHPKGGYNVLPTSFWVWDELSLVHLKENYSQYKVINGGNPSIPYFSKDTIKIKYDKNKPTILITVQPLAEILPAHVYQSIRETSDKYNWWIRLHPRMNKAEVRKLKSKLADFEIEQVITLGEVSELPLPQVLANTDLHVSKFSGAISEAAIMNVNTVIIDQLGVDSYQDLIKQKLAFSCTSTEKESFLTLVGQLTSSEIARANLKQEDYKKCINEFI